MAGLWCVHSGRLMFSSYKDITGALDLCPGKRPLQMGEVKLSKVIFTSSVSLNLSLSLSLSLFSACVCVCPMT